MNHHWLKEWQKKWGLEKNKRMHFPIMKVVIIITAVFSMVQVKGKPWFCPTKVENVIAYTVPEIPSTVCGTFMLWVTTANIIKSF